MKILFSISVHESSDSVQDLILNIKHFCEEHVIILHVSRSSNLVVTCDAYSVVYINNLRSITGFADSTLSYVHHENFLEAARLNIDYGCFVPFGSKELFIKSSGENYIGDAKKSYSQKPKLNNFHFMICRQDKAVGMLLGAKYRKSAPEGLSTAKLC